MSAANRVFQEKLKPNVLVPTKSGDLLPIATNDFAKTLRTIQSYLLSIVNLEWSTALAHKITQELPTGRQVMFLLYGTPKSLKWNRNPLLVVHV